MLRKCIFEEHGILERDWEMYFIPEARAYNISFCKLFP